MTLAQNVEGEYHQILVKIPELSTVGMIRKTQVNNEKTGTSSMEMDEVVLVLLKMTMYVGEAQQL